jgi:hypothetical protein
MSCSRARSWEIVLVLLHLNDLMARCQRLSRPTLQRLTLYHMAVPYRCGAAANAAAWCAKTC